MIENVLLVVSALWRESTLLTEIVQAMVEKVLLVACRALVDVPPNVS